MVSIDYCIETMNPAKFRRRYLGGSSDTHVAEQPGLFTDIHVEGRTGEYLRRCGHNLRTCILSPCIIRKHFAASQAHH